MIRQRRPTRITESAVDGPAGQADRPGKPGEAEAALPPSRSAQRRDALDVLALARRTLEAPKSRIEAAALPEDVAELLWHARSIVAPGARKRELQHFAKKLRLHPDAADSLRRELGEDAAQRREDTARLHRIERWRDQLLADGDAALAELCAECPELDRQRARSLMRQATSGKANRAMVANRELFRLVRDAMDTKR